MMDVSMNCCSVTQEIRTCAVYAEDGDALVKDW